MRILAFIFLVFVGFFIVQPLFSSYKVVVAKKCCNKMMKCNKQTKRTADKPCGNAGCNPFMACAYGNFYISSHNIISLTLPSLLSLRSIPLDDNRLSEKSSDWWHPPRFYAHQSV